MAQLRVIEAEAYCPVEILMVPGARHAPQMSHGAVVIGAVAAFVARVRAMDGLTSNILLDGHG